MTYSFLRSRCSVLLCCPDPRRYPGDQVDARSGAGALVRTSTPRTVRVRCRHAGLDRLYLEQANNRGDVLLGEQVAAADPRERDSTVASLLLDPPLRAAQQPRNLSRPVV